MKYLNVNFNIEIQIPDWATWEAKDAYGKIYVYENQPELNQKRNDWIPNGLMHFVMLTPPIQEWRESAKPID